MTPFLWLVVLAFAAFVLVVGGVSIWTAHAERTPRLRAPSAARRTAEPDRAPRRA